MDLTGMKSAERLAGITRICNVVHVIVPESLLDQLMGIPMENIVSIVPVPDGAHVQVISGLVTMSGEALASPQDDGENILVVTGVLVLTTPVMASTRRLIVTGQVLAPKGSETALGAAVQRATGTVAYYPYAEDCAVRFENGSMRMRGETLANPAGSEHDILIVNGQLLITSPIERVGYTQIVVNGQMVAPRESQVTLEPYLHMNGQMLYYAGTPRFFDGHESFSQGFFALLDKPITLILLGSFQMEADVTPEILQEKVTEIVLSGKIKAARKLLPVLQMLAVEKNGRILADDDEQP